MCLQVHRMLKDDGVFVFGTMNRSLRTRASLWWHTEWQRDRPRQLFDWRLGITPAEMKQIAEEVGLNLVHEELQGVCDMKKYMVDWKQFPWVLQEEHQGSQACQDTGKHYLGWAYKQPRVAGAAAGDDRAAGKGHEEL